MGEIAEMMLDGCLCAGCGEYLGADNGYPEYCASCRREELGDKRKEQSRSDKMCNAISTMVIECLEEGLKGKMPKDIGEMLSVQLKGLIKGVYNATGEDLMHDGIRKSLENNKSQKRKR